MPSAGYNEDLRGTTGLSGCAALGWELKEEQSCPSIVGDMGWDQPVLLPVSPLRAGEVFILLLGQEKVRGVA